MKPLNKETRKLIEASIDGSITPAQEARLSNILAESKEAASLHRQLLELEQSLQSEKTPNHHIDVADKVMQKISAKQQPAFSLKSFLKSISGLFHYFPTQYAVAMLAGIVIGAAFSWFLSGPHSMLQDDMLSGSMVAGKQETISFTKDNTSMKIIPYEIEDMVYLNFVVNSREDVEIVVEYVDLDIALLNANYISAAGNQFTDYGMNKLSFGALGRTNFQVIMEKMQHEPVLLSVTVLKNQRTLYTQRITIN
jgi:hypothetical protein